MPFGTLCSIGVLNFKAPVAETGILASPKIVYLESMINRLSVDVLVFASLHLSVEVKSRFFQLSSRKKRES
jgi:hypothetical protein